MATLTKLALSLALPLVALSASGTSSVEKTNPLPDIGKMRYQARNHKTLFQSERASGIENINSALSLRSKKSTGKAISPNPDFSIPASDQYEYLDGPNGSVYFCSSEFETEDIVVSEYYTKTEIKAYKFTIYDDKLNYIGEIKGKVQLDSTTDPSNPETGVASLGLNPLITKKFFNSDEKYEVMVYFNMNTPNYTVNSRSVAYQIGGEKDSDGYDIPLCTIQGNLCDVLEASINAWSEDFYLSFASDYEFPTDPDDDSFGAYVNSRGAIIETYKKVSYGSKEPVKFFEYKMRLNDWPGDQESASPFISLNIDGKPYFVVNGYTDGLWTFEGEDEYGLPNQLWNENTDFFIDIYQPKSLDDPNRVQHTVIDMQKSEGSNIFATFYYLGNLTYRGDINFEYCDEPGKANFIVTTKDWDGAEMGNTSNYYLYAPDGSIKATLGTDIDGVLSMSDIQGQEPEYMFVTTEGNEYLFTFLCPFNGNKHHSFKQLLSWEGNPEGLYVNADRVVSGDSYKYCFELTTPGVDEDGNDVMRLGWINTDGEIIDVDEVNMGKNVVMAKVYIDQQVMNPYYFDNTPEREYMIILKRGNPYSTHTQEEFIIGTAATAEKPVGNMLLHVVPDDERGNLMQVAAMETYTSPLLLVTFYNYSTAKYAQEFYNLPLTKFSGGDGTIANPYLISTIGDFQSIRDNLSAHYEIVSDVDAEGYDFKTIGTSTNPFTGTIKGNGHTISNLVVGNNTNYNALFSYVDNAEISGITFLNPTLNIADALYSSLLASHAQRTTFSDIHVVGLNVNSQSGSEFGAIVNNASLNTVITGCSVSNASINLPNSSTVGGIAADTRTGTTISASSFSGSLTGKSVVGGILGTSGPNSGGISDCHVDADIAAENIVGGIVGEIDERIVVDRCYVEGTISASKTFGTRIVNKGYAAGGIAGMVSTLYLNNTSDDGTGDSKLVITNCLVNLESITTPELPEGHQKSVHRIAGFTSINDIQPDWENITDSEHIDKFLPTEAEAGFMNNYAVASLGKIDNNIDTDVTTTEGKDVNASDLDNSFFESLGFKYGETADLPWKQVPENDPSLYHESSSKFLVDEITAVENSSFNAELLIVTRRPMSADEFIDGFAGEISNEDVVEMNGEFDFNKNVARIGFNALKPGTSEFTANVNGNLAKVKFNIVKGSSAIGEIMASDDSLTINFNNAVISVADADIEVFAINGTKVASGHNSVSLESLESGIYVVSAKDKSGHKASRKFLLQ